MDGSRQGAVTGMRASTAQAAGASRFGPAALIHGATSASWLARPSGGRPGGRPCRSSSIGATSLRSPSRLCTGTMRGSRRGPGRIGLQRMDRPTLRSTPGKPTLRWSMRIVGPASQEVVHWLSPRRRRADSLSTVLIARGSKMGSVASVGQVRPARFRRPANSTSRLAQRPARRPAPRPPRALRPPSGRRRACLPVAPRTVQGRTCQNQARRRDPEPSAWHVWAPPEKDGSSGLDLNVHRFLGRSADHLINICETTRSVRYGEPGDGMDPNG